eukprot:SAG31_NODE_237_length_19590_cov_13.149915_4_plen_95_part_00
MYRWVAFLNLAIACKYATRPQSRFELASLWHTSDYAYKPHKRFEQHSDAVVRRQVAGLRALGPAAESLAGRVFKLSKNGGQRVPRGMLICNCSS